MVWFECSVNYFVHKIMGHGSSFHRIFPKLLIESIPSQLESLTSVLQSTVKLFGSSPSQLESQTSVCRPTLKLFGSSSSQLKSQESVYQLMMKIFNLGISRLSFGRRRNCWLKSQTSVLRPSQPIMNQVLDVCPLTVTQTKMSPNVCTAQN